MFCTALLSDPAATQQPVLKRRRSNRGKVLEDNDEEKGDADGDKAMVENKEYGGMYRRVTILSMIY